MVRWRAPTHRPRNAASKNTPPADWKAYLGRKVSIRYLLHDADHPFSEAIGVVQSVRDVDGGQQVEILNKRGEVASFAARDVLAAKLFKSD